MSPTALESQMLNKVGNMSLQTISQILQTISTPCPTPTMTTTWASPLESDHRKTKFEIDPLLCSVAYHRKNSSYGLQQNKDDIVDSDVQMAKSIREYYSKKYFWNALKRNQPQSEFRINAYRLLSIEKDWDLTERESGLFVKLPAFYAEDQIYDQFKSTLITGRPTYVNRGPMKSVVERLEYLGNTFRWQGSKRVSYWFKDNQRKLYSYTTAHNHPFNALFEERVQNPQLMEFSCGIDNISDMWYNNIGTFKFVKE